MKPRPSSADLTQEDWLAWLHARHGFHEISWLALVDAYEAADRRDAELMYVAQWRWRMGYRQSRPWCPYRGPLEIFDYGQRLLLGGQL